MSIIGIKGTGIVAAFVLTGLAACTDPNQDACGNANRSASLGNLAGNALSGSYGDCIDSLQQELQGLRLEGRQLEAEASRLNSLSASLSGERRAAAQRLASLNAEQANLVSQIAQAGQSGNASEAQVQSVINQERNLRSDIASAGDGVDPDTAALLERRQAELDQLALDLL
ncbi:hypothetical protein [Yoonia sp. SS1-5]|uniref:Lipoprotein n=1 Tax=Yoonia rhodophyticola TaxID=3137370 RepID=A0AAN0NLJ4_9RHOB